MPVLSRPQWSTTPSDYPGVWRRHRRHSRWAARIAVKGLGWCWLGSFESEWLAVWMRRNAETIKRAGLLKECQSRAEVRDVVLMHLPHGPNNFFASAAARVSG